MKCARLGVFDSMPRTGVPDHYDSWSEYERAIDRLVSVGVMEDSSKIWWDLRPSAKFPTLEMRITDVCTRLEDALCIAALYQSILRMLARLRDNNMRWRVYQPMFIEENRWRAERYGCTHSMIDLGKGECVPFSDLIEDILALIAEDAEALGCTSEVVHARTILERGTSACQQMAAFASARAEGADRREAMQVVVDELIVATKADLPDVLPLS
jgi:carboxylate-amine ligase